MTKARCNPLWQPIPCPLSDIEGLESWLGDMAAQGLVPVTIGQNFARFRCSQPKAVRYRLNAKPAPETFLGTPECDVLIAIGMRFSDRITGVPSK